MNREYDSEERVILSDTGSSARLVDENDLDPALRRQKTAEAEGTGDRCIHMFCERYRDRGVAAKVHADASRQKKQEALDRAIMPGKISDRAAGQSAQPKAGQPRNEQKMNRYRSGVSEGKRYMTVDDFDRYYRDRRVPHVPQYRAADTAAVRRDKAELAVDGTAMGGVDLPKKAGWLTDTDKLPAPVRKLITHRFFRWLNVWAGETFPRETEMTVSREKARRIPAGAVAALVTVAVSMSLVIGSTVLVSQSTREVSELKDALAEKQAVVSTLNDQIDLKNDLLGIRDKAVNELGMVNEKYLSGDCLDPASESGRQDYLEVFEDGRGRTEEEQSGWAAILSAFGFGKK